MDAEKLFMEMSEHEKFDYTVIHHCPYVWNLGDYKDEHIDDWILDHIRDRQEKGK